MIIKATNSQKAEYNNTGIWRENLQASGGRAFRNIELRLDIFMDLHGEARLKEIDSDNWIKFISYNRTDSHKDIIQRLMDARFNKLYLKNQYEEAKEIVKDYESKKRGCNPLV